MRAEEIKDLIKDFDYGMSISEEYFCSIFKISRPDLSGSATEIIKNTDDFRMKKLSAYGSLNEQLLSQGMCINMSNGSYKIPLISEMQDAINLYYKSSNKKFKKAEKLRKSFSHKYPVEAKEVNDKINREVSLRGSIDKKYTPIAHQ